MDLGFHGEVTEFYHRYRRGYPTAVLDELVALFGLTGDDVVLDLGCGTGQLTVPLAERVRAVIGMDPSADMLARARAGAEGVGNVSWLLGADTDVPALGELFGDRRFGVVTIGQALHWMDHETLFGELAGRSRGVAVVTNGSPLWQQDTDWSRALLDCVGQWLGTRPTNTCGTDEVSQRRYASALSAAGAAVHTTAVEYTDELDLDRIVGGVYSALSVDKLPALDQRTLFAEQVECALAPHAPFTEHVRVSIVAGQWSSG